MTTHTDLGESRDARRLFRTSPRYANYVLLVCCAVYALNFLDRQILNMLLDPIKAEFGATDTQMGLLTGMGFSLSCMLFSIPLARWSDIAREDADSASEESQ